jgi:hypothetical protein
VSSIFNGALDKAAVTLAHELDQGVTIWLRVGLEGDPTCVGRLYNDGRPALQILASFFREAASYVEREYARANES